MPGLVYGESWVERTCVPRIRIRSQTAVVMDPSSGNRIELRRYQRHVITGPCLLSFSQFTLSISVTGDAEGEGMVINLSPKGCMVESEAAVKVAEAMSLIMLLPDQTPPTTVDLALVRWVKNDAFGLEFIPWVRTRRRESWNSLRAWKSNRTHGHDRLIMMSGTS
jgi:hypothetical protein